MAAEVFDGTAFETLLTYLSGKADHIADDFVVSKQVLASVRNAEAAIRSRSEYLPEAQSGLPLAAKFAMLLDLLILGQRPGVGRAASVLMTDTDSPITPARGRDNIYTARHPKRLDDSAAQTLRKASSGFRLRRGQVRNLASYRLDGATHRQGKRALAHRPRRAIFAG